MRHSTPLVTTHRKRDAPAPGRYLVALGYVALGLALLGRIVPYKVGGGGTFGQLATGRYLLEYGIPFTESFSYLSSEAGYAYTEHAWLRCVPFWLLYQGLGAGG